MKFDFKYLLKKTPITLSLIAILVFFTYEQSSVSTSGLYVIEEKVYDCQNYHVVLDDMRVSCSWNEYNLINLEEKYLVTFKWSKRRPHVGKLEYIKPAD